MKTRPMFSFNHEVAASVFFYYIVTGHVDPTFFRRPLKRFLKSTKIQFQKCCSESVPFSFFRLSSNNYGCNMGYFQAWCCVQVSVSTSSFVSSVSSTFTSRSIHGFHSTLHFWFLQLLVISSVWSNLGIRWPWIGNYFRK